MIHHVPGASRYTAQEPVGRSPRTDEASVRVGPRASSHRPAGAISLVLDLDGTPVRSDLPIGSVFATVAGGPGETVGLAREARIGPLAAIRGGALAAAAI